MEQTIQLRGQNIHFEFTQHQVKLTNDAALTALLSNDTEAVTDELVQAIKDSFRKANNKDIEISDSSMAVEIWGHVYAESFAAAIKGVSSFGLLDGLADKIIGHCEVIDMGESGRDNNRFIWNTLAPFKSKIAALLPKKN